MYQFDDEMIEFYNMDDQDLIVNSYIDEVCEMIFDNG
jgi:hypothetical protein